MMNVPVRWLGGRSGSNRSQSVALAAAMACAGSACALPPSFTGLGVLPGGTDSQAYAVTPNGSVVVGASTSTLGDRAFRWSRSTGMQNLGKPANAVDSRGVSVSADGKVVVGYSSSPSTGYRAFRWTNSTGMTDLGTLPGGEGSYSVGTGVSDDGKVVVGYSTLASEFSFDLRAFRWTTSTGMQSVGTLPGGTNSYGEAISGDGAVIVGVSDSEDSFDFRAFRLPDGGTMQNLGTLENGNFTIPFGTNADGSAIVGYGRSTEGLCAFRWTSHGGLEKLGKIPGAEFTIARAVSADGTVVVGDSAALSGDIAFLWTPSLGLTNLNTYLLARGVDLTGWALTAAYGVSADGLTIVGVGIHNNHEEAWVAFLGQGQDLSPIEQLGKSIMFDSNLSSPGGQSCISCHSQQTGFTNPLSDVNAHGAVHAGAISSLFGNRKPAGIAYNGDSPPLHSEDGTWVGGVFFDGRATGWTLGDPLAEQALQPFLRPLEQNNPDEGAVVAKVASANYASLFRDVWGSDSLPAPGEDPQYAYQRIAQSIAAYERSREVNPFNSKYDEYLAGRTQLSRQEAIGLALFNGVAGCAGCHPSDPGPNGEPPLFTDFTYDNIGIPRNPENPFYAMPPEFNPDGEAFADPGLGGFLQQAGFPKSVFGPNIGKHKVPTLRNVDRRPDGQFVKAFGHNGYFKSLEEVVHFYNTRDVEPWPAPEIPQNVNIAELGNLHLTYDEELAIVAFLKTLSDQDVTPVLCPADFDRSGFVDRDDFDAFVGAFEAGTDAADFDRSGFVDTVDFDLFVLAFEAGC